MNESDAIGFIYNPDQPNRMVSRNFKLSEFASKCGSYQVLIHPALLVGLQAIRDAYGRPIRIKSGYRTIGHNAKIGGAPNSYHTKGMAVDITCDEMELVQGLAQALGMVARMYRDRNFLHIDVGVPRSW